MRCVIPALLGLVVALPARACLNDRQVLAAENEFRSAYQHPPTGTRTIDHLPVTAWVAAGLGVAGLIATPIMLRRGRPRP